MPKYPKVTAADVEVDTSAAHGAPLASVVREKAGVLIDHLRRCCVGLSLVALLRAAAYGASARPSGDTHIAHCFSSVSDVAALPLGLLVLCCDCALQKDVLGSIMTLLLAAALCDATACASLIAARRAPWGVGHTGADIWECALVASCALQAVLLRGAWELYGLVRTLSSGDPSPVSPLECICEEENAQLLADCDGCTPGPGSQLYQARVERASPSAQALLSDERLEVNISPDHEDLMIGRIGYLTSPFQLVPYAESAHADSVLMFSGIKHSRNSRNPRQWNVVPTDSVRSVSNLRETRISL